MKRKLTYAKLDFGAVLVTTIVLFLSPQIILIPLAQAPPNSLVARKSNYQLITRDIPPYPELKAQSQTPAPSNASLLSEMVSLTVDNPSQTRSITVKQRESFLAIDGASQSLAIEVKYRVVLPDGTSKEYITNAKKPFNLLLPNSPIGSYTITLSTVFPGNTTAWIQATTLSGGTSLVDRLEKEHLHLAAGQAKYFTITKLQQEWISFQVSRIAGEDTTFRLFTLPSVKEITRNVNSFAQFYTPKDLPEGQYLFSITNNGHTDVSIIIATPKAVVQSLNLNEGKLVTFQIPSDLEFFWLNLNRTMSWLAFDGALTTKLDARGEGRYILYGPDWNKVLGVVSNEARDLIHYFIKNLKTGSYLLMVAGNGFPNLTLKFTSEQGVEDFMSYPKFSVSLNLKQSGQSIYYKVQGIRQLVEVVAPLRGNLILFNLINPKLEVFQQTRDQPFIHMAKGSEAFYYIALQGQTGTVILHVRARGQEDYKLDTPDYTDFTSRFNGDAIFLNMTLRQPRYIIQYSASLGEVKDMENRLWVLSEEPKVVASAILGSREDSFNIWRVGQELGDYPRGSWLTVLLSNAEGPRLRLSTLQAGDEQVEDTPYHAYQTFDFDYQLKTVKVSAPKSRWLTVITFTATISPAKVYFLDPKLNIVATHLYGAESDLRYNVFENPLEGPWLIPLVGLKVSNVSLAMVSHLNLLGNVTGLVKVVVSGDVAALQQRIDQLTKEIQSLQAKLKESEANQNRLTSTISSLQDQIREKELQIKELKKTIEILKQISGQAPRQAYVSLLFPYTIDELFLYASLILVSNILLSLIVWVVIGFVIGFTVKWRRKLIAFLLMSSLILVIYLQMGATVFETLLGYLRLFPLYIIPCLIGLRIGSFARRQLSKHPRAFKTPSN